MCGRDKIPSSHTLLLGLPEPCLLVLAGPGQVPVIVSSRCAYLTREQGKRSPILEW
jgi:hypothetical protein